MNCLYIDTCKSGDLRLTDDLTYYKGRVEMYQNSEWRTICNDGWDVNDAIVAVSYTHLTLPTNREV